MKQFSMGNAFNEAKAFVMQSPFLYIGLIVLIQIVSMAVMFLPMGGIVGLQAMAVNGSDPEAMSQMMAGFGGLFFLSIMVGVALAFAGNFAVWRHGLADGSVSVGQALLYGVKACFPALFFAIIAYVALFVGAMVFALAFGGLGAASGSGGFMIALAVISALGIFVGMIYLLARFSVMGPEMADNNSLNPFAAAGRSWNATRGNGWMIALFFALCYIVFFVIYMVAAMVVAGIGGVTGSEILTLILSIILTLPILMIGVLLGVGLPAGVYRDLVGRADKSEIFS